MTTHTDIAPKPAGGGVGQDASGLAFDTGTDRSQAFAAAHRHSRIVRWLRRLLPVITMVVVGIYVFSIMRTAGVGGDIASLTLPRILPTDLAMQNPHYEGYAEDGSMYKVKADLARPNLKTPNLVELEGITAELIDNQKQNTVLKATRGLFDNNKSILNLNDGINITGDNGLKAKLQSAVVNSKTNVITSDQPVEVEFPAGSVRSDKLRLKQKVKHATFINNVVANLKPPPEKKKSETDVKEKTIGSANRMFVGSNQPVAITSETLDIYDADSRALFKGTVRARQGLAKLTTPELEVSYDRGAEDEKTAKAAADLTSATGGKLRRIVAKGPVVMTQGPQDRITAEAADFDALNETAVLTGKVRITSGANRRVDADRVDLDQAREVAVLTGNVVVTQDKNVLRGRRLEVDQKQRVTLLSSPAGIGYGAGQISARFVQTGKPKSKPAPTKTGGLGGGGAFQADPNAPLDITARKLLVKDTIKTAIFSGQVQARQGAFKIAATELHALYKGSAALGDVTSRNSSGGGATSLTTVKAKQNVVITGKDGQRVKGDWADFDVVAGKAVVGGKVEVRQGGNVIQCSRLTIDTKSGQTIIDAAPKNTVAKPQGGGWVTTGGNANSQTAAPSNRGRPSAVFYLNDIDKARSGRGKTKKSPSSGSAWQAQTAPR